MAYDTWDISSSAVKEVFDSVIAQGFSAQVLEAYDENNDLIHPNEVEEKLHGVIVTVVCTLEKMLFEGRDQPGGRAWQFFANLVKVQIIEPLFLENPSPTPKKHKFIPSYLDSDGISMPTKRNKIDEERLSS
jgi:hypothetical protein